MKDHRNNRIIDAVIKTAKQTGSSAFLVGGAVRDYIRNDFNHNDLDFVVSDSLDLFVEGFSKKLKGKIIVWDENDRRVVIRINGENIHVDFALCKGETIQDDLKFRDITIHAVAIDVNHRLLSVFWYTAVPLLDAVGQRSALLSEIWYYVALICRYLYPKTLHTASAVGCTGSLRSFLS